MCDRMALEDSPYLPPGDERDASWTPANAGRSAHGWIQSKSYESRQHERDARDAFIHRIHHNAINEEARAFLVSDIR